MKLISDNGVARRCPPCRGVAALPRQSTGVQGRAAPRTRAARRRDGRRQRSAAARSQVLFPPACSLFWLCCSSARLPSRLTAASDARRVQMQANVPQTKQLEDSYALPGKSAYESVPSMCARLCSPALHLLLLRLCR